MVWSSSQVNPIPYGNIKTDGFRWTARLTCAGQIKNKARSNCTVIIKKMKEKSFTLSKPYNLKNLWTVLCPYLHYINRKTLTIWIKKENKIHLYEITQDLLWWDTKHKGDDTYIPQNIRVEILKYRPDEIDKIRALLKTSKWKYSVPIYHFMLCKGSSTNFVLLE